MIRKLPLYDFNSFKFIDIYFMAQNMVYFGEGFSCALEKNLFSLVEFSAIANYVKLVDSVTPTFYSFTNLLSTLGKLSLVVASRGYSLLQCVDFPLLWLFLSWSTGSGYTGFSSCSSQVKQL